MNEQLTVTMVRFDTVDVPSMSLRVQSVGGVFEHHLGVAPVVIGSQEGCDIVLTDERVSRRHCELQLGDRGVLVRDLASKNGCFIGNIRVNEGYLPLGVPLAVGDARITALLKGAARSLPLSRAARFGEAIGSSVPMRLLFAALEQAAPMDETVLLLGDSGTGKELLAHGIHGKSKRASGPFVVFDCSSVVAPLLESELFGHVRGAFTGADRDRAGALARAHGGTLFIDEIGELALEQQPKLLRAIEERRYKPVGGEQWHGFDARIVAATNRDLASLVASGHFRQDLYYRLSVLALDVPPLRHRKEDIPLLVERFLEERDPPMSLANLPPNAVAMLKSHDWPGNVRELRNTVARLVTFPHLPGIGRAAVPRATGVDARPWREARAAAIEDFERSYLAARLAENMGNVSKTAKAIGVSRQFLHQLLERTGLARS